MQQFSTSQSQPLAVSSSTESQTYLLFALAIGLTVVGVFTGFAAMPLLSSPVLLACMIAELAIIFTSGLWVNARPLNYLLFILFPLLSGFTFTPYIVMLLSQYVNGAAILGNALLATVFMALAASVFARTTSWNLGVFGRALFFAVIGLIVFSLLQLFIPALRTSQIDMMFSGAGVVIFAAFTAYDLQRIQNMGKAGASPFLMALSLYLDIYNLFLFILRFMLAISGQRR